MRPHKITMRSWKPPNFCFPMISATSTVLAIPCPITCAGDPAIMGVTITDHAGFGMVMPHLNRRAFSGLAIALAAGRRTLAAALDPFDYRGADRQKFLENG